MSSIGGMTAALGAAPAAAPAAGAAPTGLSAASTLDFAPRAASPLGDALALTLTLAGIDSSASPAASGSSLALALFVDALLGAMHQQLREAPTATLQALVLPLARAVGTPALGTLQQHFNALLGGAGHPGGPAALGGFLHTLGAQLGAAPVAAGAMISAKA